MEKVKLVIELDRSVLESLKYLSSETDITVLKLIEDFVTDQTNDLCRRFYELDKENY